MLWRRYNVDFGIKRHYFVQKAAKWDIQKTALEAKGESFFRNEYLFCVIKESIKNV